MKRNILVIVSLILFVVVFASFAFAEVKNPDTIVLATIGLTASMDPHWLFSDDAQVIYSIYDNLINYNKESITEFIPMLATEVPSVENGLIKDNGLTYIFPIRKEVKFHNGDILTPEDVVYSIKRCLIFDRSGGLSWLLCEPLLGTHGIEDKAVEVTGVEKYSDLFEGGDSRGELKAEYKEMMIKVFTDYVDKTVEVDGDNVVFHLPQAFAPFLSILGHANASWAAIIDKKWAIKQGAWDGKADTWWKYHDPECEKDPLYTIENGTGPYILKKWVSQEILMMERFDDYWRGPAKIKNVQIKLVMEHTTRKLMLQAGDADMIGSTLPQHLSEVAKIPGVTVIKNLPALYTQQGMFVWTINAEGNAYIGSGKLDGKGIPPDFFSDIHVRKGFCHLFPYDIFFDKVMKGSASRPTGPIPEGILGYADDPSLFYEFSLEKAREEFKLAWDGQLWEKGCKFNIFYNEGNVKRKGICDMLSAYAKMLNPKFILEPVGFQWPAYLEAQLTEKLPFFVIDASARYPDPHSVVTTCMSSKGTQSSAFGEGYREFARKNIDPLIEKGMKETDPAKRIEIYNKLSQIAHDQAIAIYIYSGLLYHVQRDWIKGWYFNPATIGMYTGGDYYSLTKGE